MTTPILGALGHSVYSGIGVTTMPPIPTMIGKYLSSMVGSSATVANQGHSGTTANDWIPGVSNNFLQTAVAAFHTANVTDVTVLLQTNDCKEPTPYNTQLFYNFMGQILHDSSLGLVTNGWRVHLQYAPLINLSGSIVGSIWDSASNVQLAAYDSVYNSYIDNKTVFGGDTLARGIFLSQPELFADGVHPNDSGAPLLASLQAIAIANNIRSVTSNIFDFWIQSISNTGATIYATIDSGGARWNGSSFEAVLSNRRAQHAVAMPEVDSAGLFAAKVPSGINTPRILSITVYKQAGGSPASSDHDMATAILDWNGVSEVGIGNKTGFNLGSAGLDAVSVELGVNARQALSPIAAALAGVLTVSGNNTTIKAIGNPTVTRISAVTNDTGRTSVTANLPS